MWIVRLALRRPHTFVVMAMLIVLLGGVTLLRMPTDIFPEIDIPVISVIWGYSGLAPEEMERRIVSNYERALTTTVNDIEHIESQSLTGVAVVKVFFQPGAHLEAATAQITAISQAVLRGFPAGTTAPLIIRYSASNVPILQASLASDTLPEQQLFDLGANFLRGGLAVVQGAQIPWPYGGKQRQVMVDLDLARLTGLGLSPADVSAAISAQNLVLPSGTMKLGTQELQVDLNSSPDTIEELNNLPVKSINGTVITIRDVAHVRDGFSPQTSLVHVDGKRGALLSVLKAQGSSTLDIVERVRATLPGVLATLPRELKVTLLFDQSLFVRAAVDGVVREAMLAAALTGLMMLVFLGSWRSTLIVVVSIPLSILVSLIVLNLLGQTLNVMTLGGLSLAVGILVDDATVELENIHRNLGQKKPLVRAILDGAQQIAVPAFVSTLCICIVFVPVAFIAGAARSLFVPLALAVVFAMLTSYLLSRTLVPTMVQALLKAEVALYGGEPGSEGAAHADVAWRLHRRFNVGFERFRAAYAGLLAWVLRTRGAALALFALFVAASAALATRLGEDFFPAVDAGLLKLHVRAPPGTRLEETEHLFTRVEEVVREVIPPDELETVLDNEGVPYSGINLSLGDPSMISSADGEILVALREHHRPTIEYQRRLRAVLAERFPREIFFFLAPDISTQVLNFGLSAPIDVQFVGPGGNQARNLELAQRLRAQLALLPGAVDVHLHQVTAAPALHVEVDRVMASQLGVTQRDVASDVLVSLSSSGQTAPSFWLDRKKGVQYLVAVQTPQYRVDSLEALTTTPIGGLKKNGTPQLLGNLAQVTRTQAPVNITHLNAAPTLDVLVNVDRRDLGALAADVERLVAELKADLPRGSSVVMRGQVQSMRESFGALAWGLIFAVVLVYLLLVVNFHSWLDPAIILMALPGALSGLVWMLFATGTTLSVPALMGAIMSIGVATANSVLLVTFANDQRRRGFDATQAALSAGMTRAAPGGDDGAGHDGGHVPHVPGPGRGRRTERAAGPRRHRRPAGGDPHHPLHRAGDLQPAAARDTRPAGRRTPGDRMSPEETSTADADRAAVAQTLTAPPPRTRTLVVLVVLAVGVLVVAFTAGALPRLRRAEALSAELAAARAPPSVQVVRPQAGAATRALTLPGTVQAWRETALHARTNGYLRRWWVDIGDRVKEGQLLAEIETPELDQELAQARATLAQQDAARAQARASLELAQANAERYLKLAPSGVASQQEVEERTASRRVAQANLEAADAAGEAVKANLARLTETKLFARVLAPFTGVITTRTTEVGSLVTAGTSGGAPLFHVAQVDPVRVFISVPQGFATQLTWGAQVPVKVREFGDRVFPGTVVRTAGALDEGSRTLLTEVQVPNTDGTLMAGMYAQVTLEGANAHTPWRVPSTALLTSAEGPRVALVRDGVVRFVPVHVETDLGTETLLSAGLTGDEQVVVTPSERLVEGLAVTVAPTPAKAKP